MVKYIDVTPTWQSILPTWKMIVGDAVKIEKPEQMTRFWSEMESMAAAADKWNQHCKEQNNEA